MSAGTWMEFGVFRGDTINAAADYRKAYCETDPPPVYGFDTFQGLPETWGNHMEQVQHPNFVTLDCCAKD